MDAANNDTVMVITRGELMAEVAKVVNREVQLALTNCSTTRTATTTRAAPIRNARVPTPNATTPCRGWRRARSGLNTGVVGEGRTSLARLPIALLNKDFDASFTALWSLDGTGTVQFTGAEPPAENCVRHNFCTQMINDKPVSGAPTPTPVFPRALARARRHRGGRAVACCRGPRVSLTPWS